MSLPSLSGLWSPSSSSSSSSSTSACLSGLKSSSLSETGLRRRCLPPLRKRPLSETESESESESEMSSTVAAAAFLTGEERVADLTEGDACEAAALEEEDGDEAAAAGDRPKNEVMRPWPGASAAAFLGVLRLGVVRATMIDTDDGSADPKVCQKHVGREPMSFDKGEKERVEGYL